MLAHTHGQRLYPTQYQPAIHGTKYSAGSILNELQPFSQVAIVQDHGPTNAIAMSIEILGCAVDNDVSAQAKGLLQIRAHESVINRHRDVTLMGDGGYGGNVRKFHHGVRGRLDKHEASVGFEGRTHVVHAAGVHVAEDQSEAL